MPDSSFTVILNQQIVFRYHGQRLPARLRRHLDEIEQKLHSGFKLGEQVVDQPSALQIQQYVAMMLVTALDKKDAGQAELFSAYLSSRYQRLREIQVSLQNDIFNLQLIED